MVTGLGSWGDAALGVVFFVGLVVLLIVVPMLLSLSPQALKDFFIDHIAWFFFGGIVLLLIWENA